MRTTQQPCRGMAEGDYGALLDRIAKQIAHSGFMSGQRRRSRSRSSCAQSLANGGRTSTRVRKASSSGRNSPSARHRSSSSLREQPPLATTPPLSSISSLPFISRVDRGSAAFLSDMERDPPADDANEHNFVIPSNQSEPNRAPPHQIHHHVMDPEQQTSNHFDGQESHDMAYPDYDLSWDLDLEPIDPPQLYSDLIATYESIDDPAQQALPEDMFNPEHYPFTMPSSFDTFDEDAFLTHDLPWLSAHQPDFVALQADFAAPDTSYSAPEGTFNHSAAPHQVAHNQHSQNEPTTAFEFPARYSQQRQPFLGVAHQVQHTQHSQYEPTSAFEPHAHYNQETEPFPDFPEFAFPEFPFDSSPMPETSQTAAIRQANSSSEGFGKTSASEVEDLVGLGLHLEDEDTQKQFQQLNQRNPVTPFTGMLEPPGKGLKLEETWSPPDESMKNENVKDEEGGIMENDPGHSLLESQRNMTVPGAPVLAQSAHFLPVERLPANHFPPGPLFPNYDGTDADMEEEIDLFLSRRSFPNDGSNGHGDPRGE